MKIELYMLVPLLVSIIAFYRYLNYRKLNGNLYKIAAPVHLMLSILGAVMFMFFLYNGG
jgi:hypothetical protein